MKRRMMIWALVLCMLSMLCADTYALQAEDAAEPESAAREEQQMEETESEGTDESPSAESPSEESPSEESPSEESPSEESPSAESPSEESPSEESPSEESPSAESPSEESLTEESPSEESPSEENPTEENGGAQEDESKQTEVGTDETQLPVSLEVQKNVKYAIVWNRRMSVTAQVSGGTAPYHIKISIRRRGTQVYSDERTLLQSGSETFEYMPDRYGEYEIRIDVTDGASGSAGETVILHAAEEEKETREEWEASIGELELSGDWREDLIKVAVTQLGYTESQRDFIVRGDGHKQGYTRYGDWCGYPYSEWCAMFIYFSMEYAGIPQEHCPRSGNCVEWQDAYIALGAYEEDVRGYIPRSGDIVFFDPDGGRTPEHVGIVYGADGERLVTVEGNVNGSVCICEYKADDRRIIGYANTTKLMDRAGLLESVDVDVQTEDASAQTAAHYVYMRSVPSVSGEKVHMIARKGTAVEILGVKSTGGILWYEVSAEEHEGFVRSDLLEVRGISLEQEERVIPPLPVPDDAEETQEHGAKGMRAYTAGTCINMRSEPDVESPPVYRIVPTDTPVSVLETVEKDGETWYLTQFGEYTGYIRSDLLRLE